MSPARKFTRNCFAQVSLLKHADTKTTHLCIYMYSLLDRTIPRGQTHDQQMGVGCFGRVACLCVGARESYLCHHEYVIKPPLKKDGVPRQGVHEAGTWVFFVSAESLLCALSCITERRRQKEENE